MYRLAVVWPFCLVACSTLPDADTTPVLRNQLPPGSNQVLRAPIAAAPNLEVIVSDVIIPPGATVPKHFHPGEEFVYVIEGSAVHVEEGKADRLLSAGDAITIAPQTVHSPKGGESGARAIVFRVHVKDAPERIPVAEDN